MQRARMTFAAAVAVVLIAAGAYAQPQIVTVASSPLKLNVASDGSMQIYNSAVPGTGQIYPSGNAFGDFGVFAWIDGTLFAPDFANHGGSATGGLGTYTPWQSAAISDVSGDGSPANPYTVGVSLRAPGTDVRVSLIVTHVRGNNFFRLRSQFFADSPHTINAFVGADIYLAGSDHGLFVGVPELNAVGGRNCDPAEGAYNILLIPITTASRFTTGFYGDVWSQIGAGELDNTIPADTSCIDNGAAIQWNDIMRDSTAVELNTAVSFGEVPSAANFHGFFIDVDPDTVTMLPGESVRLTVKATHNEELGFNAPITLSAPNLPQGMHITFDRNSFPAPGDGTTNATLTLDSSVFPQLYRSVGIFGSGGRETRAGFFAVNVLCDPPKILGLSTSQPLSQTIRRGQTATLSVKPEGGGAFSYQWYNGHAPLIWSPIPGANSATYVTPALTDISHYWVRVSNPCGSTDSLTATVTPVN